MRVLVGTSGFSYKQWKGPFYPQDLPADGMLRYYAAHFPVVEINNTFYRMPARRDLERWASQAGDGFEFALKAPRRITHVKRLSADAEDDVSHLFTTAGALGEALGPVLFQLPPFLRKDLGCLEAFLDALPLHAAAAFEFRHASWNDADVHAALRARGAALCTADTDEGGERPAPVVATANWGYLRLRRSAYSDADLEAWAGTIAAQPWATAYVFLKHEDEGQAPRLAARLRALLGTLGADAGPLPRPDRLPPSPPAQPGPAPRA